MSASEDEFQQRVPSSNRSQTSQQSIDGWISVAAKRAKTPPATSSTSTQRTVR